MPVLVDPIHHYPHVQLAVSDWCHMAVDGEFEELHAFAASLGIPRSRFQGDHYDLPPWIRARAVVLGAEEVTTAELLVRMAGRAAIAPAGGRRDAPRRLGGRRVWRPPMRPPRTAPRSTATSAATPGAR